MHGHIQTHVHVISHLLDNVLYVLSNKFLISFTLTIVLVIVKWDWLFLE